MNENSVKFKTCLYVDEKLVAQSDDLNLWQRVLASINSPSLDIQTNAALFGENGEQSNNNSKAETPIERFSKEVEIDCGAISDALSPTLEAPFIHLDMKTWENYKRKFFQNKRPIPDVVIVGTILALWKKNADLGDATQKEILTILKQLNISASNPSRSYKNCEWLKYENNKIYILVTKYSLAINMLKDYCSCV